MVEQTKKKKIILIGDSLDSGGAEKVHAILSNYFQESNFEVFNCIFLDKVSYKYSGSLLNLAKIQHSNSVLQKWKRFSVLKNYFKANSFDIVIDFRMRTSTVQELLLSELIFPNNTFYTIHSAILNYYLPENSFLAKITYNSRKVVSVSKAVQQIVNQRYNFENSFQIYNPIDFKEIQQLQNEFKVNEPKYIVAAGRMNDTIKQFDQLIECYSKSILPQKGIKLVFLGDGGNKNKLQTLTEQLGLSTLIEFKGFVANPFPYYKEALFTVLSSKNEGFPNVLIESLSTQTPVVAFDCFSGPNEIIEHEINGLLVDNQNFEALTEAMNKMIENVDLYQKCKLNSKESVRKFDIQIIGQLWQKLFKNVVS
ncbi:glycosyltransferase [Flavobacterium sp.]